MNPSKCPAKKAGHFYGLFRPAVLHCKEGTGSETQIALYLFQKSDTPFIVRKDSLSTSA